MQETKKERLSQDAKNRYSQFREQFDDIFEVTLSKKKDEIILEVDDIDRSHK